MILKNIFTAIVWIAGFIVIIDFLVAVLTNTEPYLQKLLVGIGLLLIGGVLCIILLVRDTVFLDFGSALVDIQLLVQISVAFLAENTTDFISLFISIGQFPFVMIGEAMDTFGGTISLFGVAVSVTSELSFSIDLGGIGFDITFYVKQLRFTLEAGIQDVATINTIFSVFGGGDQFKGYTIGYFSMGLVVETLGTSSVAIVSLQAAITTAIESFLTAQSLEEIVKEIVGKF